MERECERESVCVRERERAHEREGVGWAGDSFTFQVEDLGFRV
jgi:hypothetical protein